MKSIIVKHIIDESKITINFDLLNGSLSFPSIELKIEGDIDLISLVVKLTELIEQKRTLHLEYEDTNSLLKTNPKMQLVKSTLEEIYSVYNNSFNESENDDEQNKVESNSDDELSF
jgi:hypothetical protein